MFMRIHADWASDGVELWSAEVLIVISYLQQACYRSLQAAAAAAAVQLVVLVVAVTCRWRAVTNDVISVH